MPRIADRCACHGEPMFVDAHGARRCYVKVQAVWTRYAHSAKGRARNRRHAAVTRRRRIRNADDRFGYAKTPELAQAISAHYQRRTLAFKQGQQDREKTEGAASG